jgi:TetR/AcrR family transcriptional regulator, transcriptional repressor for nem operon
MRHFSELSDSALRVVDAAEGLVQDRGYNGFSYDDVAKLVGIKKPSIHHHFATKADLVATVAQRYTHKFRESLLNIEGRHAQAAVRLTAYADLFERTFLQDRRLCVCGMLGADGETLPQSVNQEVQRFFEINQQWLTEILSQGQADGTLRSSATATTLAEAYLCALEGAMVVGRGLQSPRGPKAVAQTFLATVLS